jgi:dynamin 1-like protein
MNSVTNLSSGIYNWLTKEQSINCIKALSENQILNIANDINSIFSETNLTKTHPNISLPRIVVVGTQSSGKSSVLNSIMSMDILPTGKNMVTRTPLDIRLHKLNTPPSTISIEGWVQLGSSSGYTATIDEQDIPTKIPITVPIPTQKEIETIREYIYQKTVELAGEGMNISSQPIILKIYSPYVPNLSLIDLPGLTMVAQTDKGQPLDIKDKIEKMVSSFIEQERTIILAVMQSRSDLETELGLNLIKKHDNNGQRTIGVLTKPDLMSTGEHVGKYLANNISKNLMLTYGYYVVRNRSNREMKEMNILEGIDMEKKYFNFNTEYNKSVYKERTGTLNLTNDLSKILITSITEIIPSVMTEIVALEANVNKKLEAIGHDLPETKEGKISALNRYVSTFNSKFLDSVESRGIILNTGKKIKDIFVEYRDEITNIHPFLNNNVYNKEYFDNVISSFEGNHMSFHVPPVRVLETCMTDDRLRPIQLLNGPSMRCVNSICDILINLIRDITKHDELSQYPPLANYIMSSMVDDIISKLKIKTKQEVSNIFRYQESYVWTDGTQFNDILKEATSNKFNIDTMIKLLESYYTSVKEVITDIVPKIIMSSIIRDIERTLLSYLIQNVVRDEKISLLKEDSEVEKHRKYYGDIRGRINTIKQTFSENI